MKITLLEKPRIVMSNPYSIHNYFGWPTLARLKNGRLALAASGFRLDHVCPFGKSVLSFSENEGKTYTAPAPIIDTVLDDRDAGLTPFGESGLILTSFNNTVEMQRKHSCVKDISAFNTTDSMQKEHAGGARYVNAYLDKITPEQEKEALGCNFRVSFDNGVTFGPIYHSPIGSPHGPIELKNGNILWLGRTFSPTDEFRSGIDCIKAYLVNPHDGTMTYLSRIDDIPDGDKTLLSCEPHAIELPDGTIICHIRVQSDGYIKYFTVYQSVSKDGGLTWSKPEQLLSDLGGSPPHLMMHSSGTLISTYGFREPPYGIRAMFSKDGGKHWEIDQNICTCGFSHDLGYPSTVELNDGTLLTAYYDHPEKGAPCNVMQIKWKFEE